MADTLLYPRGGDAQGTGTHPWMGRGRWYRLLPMFVPPGGSGGFSNRAFWVPFQVPFDCTLNGIAINVGTAAASSSVRFGLAYNDDGVPGRLHTDMGTVSSTTTGVKTLTPSVALKPHRLWFGVATQGGAPTLTYVSQVNGWGVDAPTHYGQTATPVAGDFTGNIVQLAYYKDSVSGAFANPIGAMTGTSIVMPLVMFKVGA